MDLHRVNEFGISGDDQQPPPATIEGVVSEGA